MDNMEIEEQTEEIPYKIKISKEIFIFLQCRGIRNNYDCTKKLGTGGFGKVFQVRNKKTKKLYACKKVSKLNINNLEKLRKEIEILKKLDHPHIVKLYEVFESDNSLYLIMEECFGGELFERILKRVKTNDMYSEREACSLIKQLIGAIEYCHNNGIVHRDIKPENLLYLKEGNEENNPIKIVDFGLSQYINSKHNLNSLVGSSFYVSPEVLASNYNEKCDIWSTGVILYILLSGDPPFFGINDEVIYKKIRNIDYSFPEEKWKNISKEAKDLISNMLIKQEKRFSASQVLQHPWFNLIKDEKLNLNKLNFGKKNFFQEYKNSNQLKKIVLLYIASKLDENEILDLNELFKAFDKDDSGQIEFKEFEQGLIELKSEKISNEMIKQYFDDIDADINGKIDYTEFIAASLQKKIFIKSEILFDAFSSLDTNHDFKITKEELMTVLKLQPKDDKFAQKLIDSADKNGDGAIDYKEFLLLMGYNE